MGSWAVMTSSSFFCTMDQKKAAPPQETKLHFLDYWRIIRIRKTVILAVFLLVVITATIVTFILPESFSSMARIKIEHTTADIAPVVTDRNSQQQYDPYFIQTEFEVIQSEVILKRVVRDLNLNEEWAKKNGSQPLKTPEVIRIIKNNLDLHAVRNTSLIEIRYYSDKPDEAAQIANAVAAAYKSYRLEQSFELMSNGIAALTMEWEGQENKVRAAMTNVDYLRTTLKISESDPMSLQP